MIDGSKYLILRRYLDVEAKHANLQFPRSKPALVLVVLVDECG